MRVTDPDEYLQCVLWRDYPKDEIRIYKLDTLTYETKPFAFLAIHAMHQLAINEKVSFPASAKIIRIGSYVNDLISEGDFVAEVAQIRHEVKDRIPIA